MAKIVDITDKLSFAENPKLKIKENILEVNADATTVLKIMNIMKNDANSIEAASGVYELLFSEAEQKKIESMKLSFDDFTTLVKAAMDLVVGGEDDEGEA